MLTAISLLHFPCNRHASVRTYIKTCGTSISDGQEGPHSPGQTIKMREFINFSNALFQQELVISHIDHLAHRVYQHTVERLAEQQQRLTEEVFGERLQFPIVDLLSHTILVVFGADYLENSSARYPERVYIGAENMGEHFPR